MTKVAVQSDRDRWVFEVGKVATFSTNGGREQSADFEVTAIRFEPRLVVETTLTGLSRYGWEPTIFWAGEYEVL